MSMQTRFSRKALVFLGIAVCAGTLIGLGLDATGQTAREPFIKPGLLDNEAKAIQASTENLMAFFKLAGELKKKTTLSAEDNSHLASSAENAKKGILEYRRNLESFIAKLRGAGKWTSDYDTFIEEAITRSAPSAGRTKLLESLRTQGGARSVLTNTLSSLDRIYGEIDKDKTVSDDKSIRVWHDGERQKLCTAMCAGTAFVFWTTCFSSHSRDSCIKESTNRENTCGDQCDKVN